MAATDGQITVAAARWADEGNYLREFVAKHRLPSVVKIIKGQYGGLGVPTLPSPGLQSTALMVSAGKRQKILAQAVKIKEKEGKRLVYVGPRLVIPDSYPGYFELLSEEGRSVKCIENVSELARRRMEEGCLVRETIRGIQAKTDLDGNVLPEGARTIAAGEILVPSGETILNKGRYLKCLDTRGDMILLGFEQRGKFSALAREDNISGVHTARNLLTKRMPLTVRLVHGIAPAGLKTPSHFVPELRLLSIYEEEHVFALPLQKDAQHVVALPLCAHLKLLRTRNDELLRKMEEFSRLVEKCNRLVADVADRIQVLDGKLGDGKKCATSSECNIKLGSGGFVALRRSSSSDSAYQQQRKHHHHHHRKDENRIPTYAKDYEDIDQIYDYVRGSGPLPKHIRSQVFDSLDIKPPEPPPIETIPTKKIQAEKRNRKGATSTIRENNGKTVIVHEKTPPGLPKLFVKNSSSQRRLFRQKSQSPLKETPPSPISKSGSPIFNIRYKSLSNLQQAMELDGTLDSSNSGGRGSGDSGGGGVKQPEKRSRKLSRPRSLNNLLWEARDYPVADVIMEKPKKPEAALVVYKKQSHSKFPHHTKRGAPLYL